MQIACPRSDRAAEGYSRAVLSENVLLTTGRFEAFVEVTANVSEQRIQNQF
jgi:hypothetical protein